VYFYYGAQAVARGATLCLLQLLGRSVKIDACGRSFAVLSTQVSAVGLAQQAAEWHHS
jgi:hypothetical protein